MFLIRFVCFGCAVLGFCCVCICPTGCILFARILYHLHFLRLHHQVPAEYQQEAGKVGACQQSVSRVRQQRAGRVGGVSAARMASKMLSRLSGCQQGATSATCQPSANMVPAKLDFPAQIFSNCIFCSCMPPRMVRDNDVCQCPKDSTLGQKTKIAACQRVNCQSVSMWISGPRLHSTDCMTKVA